jgi:hypothetical protein
LDNGVLSPYPKNLIADASGCIGQRHTHRSPLRRNTSPPVFG